MVNEQFEAGTSHYRITTVTSPSTTSHLSTPREAGEGPVPGGHYVGWKLAECWLSLPACSLPPICVSVTSKPLDWFVCPSWRLQCLCQIRYLGVCKHGAKESALPIFRVVGTACQEPAHVVHLGDVKRKHDKIQIRIVLVWLVHANPTGWGPRWDQIISSFKPLCLHLNHVNK